ncbi:type II toxin-antitoxin system prevent-host-death family antitoxin [uncultured Thiocystis sp.]|jgi:prevent-host-death family protein|uniref:type II toxin-antitoxin system Phd/YefM family antitoxin n=1 Tax=uncultured Thiocystis sp. TaxID=1202134 RepID=UPI0025FCCB15|nr:type II toxin-antitoxin system prevent-host-death family antitoxin [uncultured Thiocystis sp.]
MTEPHHIGANVAKTHLPEYLRQVQAGRRFIITQHGKPVAELAPSGPLSRQDAVAAAQRMRALMRRPVSTGASDLRTLIEEGRG